TAVLPTARSQGLGRALVTSALTHASLRGDRAVYLFSQEAGDFPLLMHLAQDPPESFEIALLSRLRIEFSGTTRGVG
ncbi:MAG: GNAT family N-acetyltransferase, partial [Deltaproteobacteria bacterium]